MIEFKNKIFTGANNRKSVFDAKISADNKAVILFVHGYKGYKDWGCWGLMEEYFLQRNMGFVKFNFSHNGGIVAEPIDFPDLDAFGKNCFSYELEDLEIITTEVHRLINQELEAEIPIVLVGHSRGGGVAVLHASKNKYISKIISLAGISSIGNRFPSGEELEDWKNSGVRYVQNARTNQDMPHYFSFFEDYQKNKEALNIEDSARSLKIPFVQIHGDMDLTVSITEGQYMARWTNTNLVIVKGAGHTFGAKQPWNNNEMPADMLEVCANMLAFIDDI